MTLKYLKCPEVRQCMIPWLNSTLTIDVEKNRESIGEAGIAAFDSHPVLKALIESLSTGILVLDKKGIVVYINKIGAQILGQDQLQAKGCHVTKIVDFRPVILDVLESGRGYLERKC
jgi:transcriptional regulator with PAS, ATPase and Fis domain